MPQTAARAGSLAALAALLFAGGASAATAPSTAPLRDVDVRSAERVAPPVATADARTKADSSLGPEATADSSPSSGALHLLQRTDGMLTGPDAADPKRVALDYVRGHESLFGLDASDLSNLQLEQDLTSPDGLTHLTWRQTVDGVPVYDTALKAHLDGDGRLASFSGDAIGGLTLDTTQPAIDAAGARSKAAGDVLGSAAGTSDPTLVAFPQATSARLAWDLTAYGQSPYVYDVVIDAVTGDLLRRRDLTDFANAQVWERHPGAPNGGGTANTVDLAQVVNGSAWLNDTAGNTRLFGNNSHTYSDLNDSDSAFPPVASDNSGEDIPSSDGTNWIYPQTSFAAGTSSCPFTNGCSWDPGVANSYTTNRAQDAVQVFYFVNKFHDHLAAPPIGFDEASGNFQFDNLQRGGLAGDPVITEPDDGAATGSGGPNTSHINNANFSTPPDGQSPRMQMYLWKAPYYAINGGDDADIVYHEYTHGLSHRLVQDLDHVEGGAMGEAWSDWYALDYLNDEGYAPDTSAPGELELGAGFDGPPHLLRTEPIDCTVGASVSVCPGTAAAGSGGYTYGDVGQLDGAANRYEVHADGEVWGQTLWDIRTAVGSDVAETLITGGMRLSPRSPGFLDERDAILQEDTAAYGGVHEAALWAIFANRGMGFLASNGNEDFSLPPAFDNTRAVIDDAPPLGNGNGKLEPGEAARISLTSRNLGTPIASPAASLTSSDPAAAIVTHATTTFGAPWAAHSDASTQSPLVVAVPATAACGSTLPLSVTVGGATLTPSITLGVLGPATTTASTNVPLTITDASTGNLPHLTTSTLTVPPGAGPVSSLQLNIGSITHSFVSDLILVLSHGKHSAMLFNAEGSNGQNLTSTVFSDSASTAIGDGTPPFTGTFRPESPLSVFDGDDGSGVWTLRMYDQFHLDQGTLSSWSLNLPTRTCSAPASHLPAAGDAPTASAVTATTAHLTGAVDPKGTSTAAGFELGTTTDYGQSASAGDAGAGDGAQAVSADVSGLAPSTTYHYRVVALRGGSPIAVGADQTFATAAADVSPPPATTTSSTPPPTTTTGPTPPPATDPKVSFSGSLKSVRLDAKRRFVFSFKARAGANGTITFVSAKKVSAGKGKKAKTVVLKTLGWTADSKGAVTVKVTVSSAGAALIKHLKSFAALVGVSAEGHTYSAKLTVKPAAKKKK